MKILCTLWDIVSANPALDVALIALVLAIWQGWQNYRHNKLSVRPLLKFDVTIGQGDGTRVYKLKLVNCGIGPAIIKDVKLFFEDKPVPLDEDNAFIFFITKITKDFKRKDFSAILLEDALVAGEKITVFDFEFQNQKLDVILKMALLIEYESFYGEKFPPLQYAIAADKK